MPARIVVVGCGHVGAVTAACLADLGHEVAGLDLSEELVRGLNDARAPFWEPGLQELLSSNISNGRLGFTLEPTPLGLAEFIFICVDTPRAGGSADLGRLQMAIETIGLALHTRPELPTVALKSTTPVGTADEVAAQLRSLLGRNIELVVNPEFLRQGSAVADFLRPDRIVVGSETRASGDTVADLYRCLNAPVIRTDRRTAELIKHASNAFLATRVSFINEVARLSDAFGTDIDATIAGIGADPRIGPAFLQAGIGFGGSCLPRDLVALITSGHERGVSTPLLEAVRDVNEAQLRRARDLLAAELGDLSGKRLAAWGATFKAGSEDTRESPAVRLIELLSEAGAEVLVYDPALAYGTELASGAEFRNSAIECCEGADAIVLLTDWPEFREVDLDEAAGQMNGHLLFDGRNALDPESVQRAGLSYRGIGRRSKELFAGHAGASVE